MSEEELVKKIVKEVLKEIQGSEPQGRGGGETVASAGGERSLSRRQTRVLALITGAPVSESEAIVQLRRVQESGGELTIVMTHGAERVLNQDRFRLGIRGVSIKSVDEITDPERVVESFDVVAIPLLSMNSAVKLAMMISDSVVSIMAHWALGKGKRVVLSGDSMLYNPNPPRGVVRRRDQVLEELSSLGFIVVKLSQLADAVLDSSGTTGESIADPTTALQPFADAGADRVSTRGSIRKIGREVAALIDHTLLKANATQSQITQLCEEAKQFAFASVCVNPAYVALAKQILKDSPVKVCTVVGFPLGATTPYAKAQETLDAVRNGAEEIDMVINVGALKSGDYETIREEIRAVKEACQGRILKVILETALLTDEEKVKACEIARDVGADFVKTSTGFGPGGATVEDVALMRRTVGLGLGVKASGGVRDLKTAIDMVRAGANRIGASASVKIARGESDEGGDNY